MRSQQSELEATKRELEKADASRKELEKLHEGIRNMELEVSSKDEKISGLEKQLKDVEVGCNDYPFCVVIFHGRMFTM